MGNLDRTRSESAVGILLLIVVAVGSAQGRTNRILEFAKPAKGTVKTIQSGNGDVVDCVDIYQQPALDHPSLKGHTIQMKPSFLKEEEDGEDHDLGLQGEPSISEGWGVDCPEGTIPIIRETSKDGSDRKGVVPPSAFLNSSRLDTNAVGFTPRHGHEYALVSLNGNEGSYHGARGVLNVWTPWTLAGEISTSQIWVMAGPPENLNTVEAGWMVEPTGDEERVTRFFTYWTSDGYKSTGCYNHKCPGFVQTHNKYGPGSIVRPVSDHGGKQYNIDIEIKQDLHTSHWWLRLQNMEIGYWPGTLFASLRGGARAVSWGGEITNKESNHMHTTTQMGSGHRPGDGYYTRSSYISYISHIEHEDLRITPTPKEKLVTYLTNHQCYDLVLGPPNLSNFGTHLYFGGYGRSNMCP